MDSLRSIVRWLAPYFFIAMLVSAVALIKHYFGLDGEETQLQLAKPVVVLDGDTLKAAETKYRIYGIDAPEFSQTCSEPNGRPWNCGRAARARLRALIAHNHVRCVSRARDRFARIVANCSVDGVPDLGEALVREGLAINFGGFTEGPYADAEMEARSAKRGMWRGAFERPADWRKAPPRTAE